MATASKSQQHKPRLFIPKTSYEEVGDELIENREYAEEERLSSKSPYL